MADIVATLDKCLQPSPPRRAHLPSWKFQPDDTEFDAVIAQIQYDVIERAYFQISLVPPLPPTFNGKAESPCRTCNHLTFQSSVICGYPKALRTEALRGVLPPTADEVSVPAEVPTCWYPRRHKPALWDLCDDIIRLSVCARDLERERKARFDALKDEVKLLSQKGVGAPWQVQLVEIEKTEAELQLRSSVDAKHSGQLRALAMRTADTILRRKTQRRDLASMYLASFTH